MANPVVYAPVGTLIIGTGNGTMQFEMLDVRLVQLPRIVADVVSLIC